MKKIIRIILGLLLSFLFIILVVNFLFGYLIKTQIKRLSNHNIELEYESSRTRLLIGTIEFRKAVLHFNDISIDSNSSIFIESVSFEKFVISRLNIKSLLFDRSFNIQKVLLKGPSIDFLKDTMISHKDIFTKNLTPTVVSDKSQSAPFSFEIGELEIDQGSFKLFETDRNDLRLGRINLKLSDIGMDDLKALNGSAPDLNANFNIQLGVYDIRKQLKGDAEILIDSIVYKKDKRGIEAGGIQLKRLKSSSDYAESEISLFMDFISIHGFSLAHFFSSKDIKFDRLVISNTDIVEKLNYFDKIKISDDNPVSKSQVFSNMINAFITDTLQIQNFNYFSENVASDTADYIDNLNLSLYSVRVDSNFILKREYISPIEKSSLSSGPISMHMPEIGIDFSSDSLVYSGPGKEQKIIGLHLKTYPSLFSKNTDQPNFYFNADSLVISGLDEREWIDSSTVELSLYVKNPLFLGSNIVFENSKGKSAPGQALNKIVLNELNLINGTIKIEGASDEKIESESLNVNVSDLEVFTGNKQSYKTVSWSNMFISVGNSKIFIPEKLLVRMDKGIINNNDLDFEGILYSEIPYRNNHKASKKATDTVRFYTDKVKIDNIDIQAFINRKHLSIDNLVISRPTYYQYSYLKANSTSVPDSVSPILLYRHVNRLLPDYFSYIHIRDFSIADGVVFYQMELNNLVYYSNNSAVMHNIEFDQQSPDGELTIDEYEFCITDAKLVSDKVQFVAESVCYNSTEDNLTLLNSHAENRVKNRNNLNTGSMQYNVNFPKIILTKPDFTPLSGGPVSFNLLHIVDPEIYIRIYEQKKHEKNGVKDSGILPFPYLEDGVKLENGKATICFSNETDSTTMEIGQIGLDSHEIHKIIGAIDHPLNNNNLFGYIDFHFRDIQMEGPGMNLAIQHIVYKKETGIVSISPIKHEAFSKTNEPTFSGFKSLINIPKINIEHPDLMLADNKIKSFGAGNLLIPTINISYESDKKEKSKENKDFRLAVRDSSFRNFFRRVDFFHIDSTVFNDIGITYRNLSDSGSGTFNIQRISLLVDDLKIDSSHFDFHKKRMAKDIVLKLHDKEMVSADSLYRIKANNITYYYSRDKIEVDSFEVMPRYDRKVFFEKAGFQTDRLQMKFVSAVAEGVDLLSIIESKKFQVRKLTLNKFHLMDHRDKHYVRKENDFKQLPKQALFNLPFVLNIDTILVNNSFLLYGEYVDESPEPGEIYFTNFNASVYHVSNFRKEENKGNRLRATIAADIMNEARMNLNLTIPLAENADYFWFSGNVERIDLRHFNSMTENLFGISIIRGKGGVDIPLISANEHHSKGTLNFEYKKLKLAMYNRNKAKLQRGLGSGLIDIMMNGMLVKSNNPTFLGKARTGDVYFERNDQRSFFNYIWKSTMSGLMTTMGFYNKDLREEKRERKQDEKTERKDERRTNK